MPKTTPTQIRLTEGDKRWIDEIRKLYGIETTAGVVRFAIRAVATWPPKELRKYQKNPQEVA